MSSGLLNCWALQCSCTYGLFGPTADQTQLSDRMRSDVASVATDVRMHAGCILASYLELQVLERSYHLWSPIVQACRLCVPGYISHEAGYGVVAHATQGVQCKCSFQNTLLLRSTDLKATMG